MNDIDSIDDDFGIKIVWVKVKVEKWGLSWRINFTLNFFSFVDNAVLFYLMDTRYFPCPAVINNVQEVKKYLVQSRVSPISRVTHHVFNGLEYQTLHDMTLTRNSGFAKYYMYGVDWNGFKNGKKGSNNTYFAVTCV